ncbi:MAG TPA: hypothetical protein VGG27_00060 [Magnetospirillaceae bacterium]|jgi:hypothetical protein
MKRLLIAFGFAAACLTVSVVARAEPIDALAAIDAPVEYKADYALTEGEQTWHGTVVHAPQRERRDFTTSMGTQALLMRRDSDLIAVIWPDRKWYLSTSLQALVQLGAAHGNLNLDRKKDGVETIGGEPCTRYKVEGAFTGKMWFTKDGILMRAAGTMAIGGHPRTISTQLSHLKRGAVDADDFELPIGYHGIPVSPNLLGGKDKSEE